MDRESGLSLPEDNNPYGAPPPGNPAPTSRNPYAAPSAKVDQSAPPPDIGELVEGGQRVATGRGLAWLTEGFGLFMQAPGMWIGITFIFILLTMAMAAVPFIGSLALNLLMPVFTAGLLLGCRALDQGEPLTIDFLFAGFKENVGQLVMVGLLYMVGVTVLVIVALLIGGVAALGMIAAGSNFDRPGPALVGAIAIFFLLVIALIVPLAMAIWYAPALVVFHKQEPMAAMRQSLSGCMKNMLPFLLYGLLLVVPSLFATLPVLLGWLVLWPVMVGGLYVSYKDIYCA